MIKIVANATAKLTKDCEIIPTACAETAGFKKAMVHYEIFKNNMPVLRGDIDGCEYSINPLVHSECNSNFGYAIKNL